MLYRNSESSTGVSSEQIEPFILYGRLSAVAFRDDTEQVEFETTLTGRFHANVPVIKKLRHLFGADDQTLKASVDGYATITENINNRLVGRKAKESVKEESDMHSTSYEHNDRLVEAKLDLVISTLNPEQLDFNWMYLGTDYFQIPDLERLGGTGALHINGEIIFYLQETDRKKRKAFAGSGFFID